MPIGDIVQELSLDLHSLVDQDTIRRKVLEAARFMRTKRLWWSEREFRFTLQAGREIYAPGDGWGLPADFREVVGDVLWILEAGSETTRSRVHRALDNEYLELKATRENTGSFPSYFNLRGGQLHVWPLETRSTDILTGNYAANLEVPKVSWESGVFVWRTEGGALLTDAELDSFDSDWFTPGRAAGMVKQRTAYLLYRDVLKDAEAAADAMTGWLEETATAEEESALRQGGGLEIPGYLL